jgi:hypothetical protein
MIIKINGVDYTFKTSFAELTLNEYLEFSKNSLLPVAERLAKFTGIPLEILNGISLDNFTNIAQSVSFIEQTEILNALAESFTGVDVGLESFDKIEKAKGLIRKSNLTDAIIEVAELYTGEEINGGELLKHWQKCAHYIASLQAFFKRFESLSLHQYTDEEIEAGVEDLERFKHYPIVFKIGKERAMSNDDVLAMPAIEVYTEMLYDYERSQYEQRYSQIIRQQQEHANKLAQ